MLSPPGSEQGFPGVRPIDAKFEGTAPSGREGRTLRPQVVTDFIPLMDVHSMEVSGRGHLVRVRLERTALLWMGLPMNEDLAESTVLADVLIGDDGLARAVRFVR